MLLIASGKGGVGKSSVTTNLAVALAQRGKSVGVLDADVWGFSIPKMLGVDRAPVVLDQMLLPPEAHGVRCISIGFFADEDQPVIWRGPMLHKALEQFLTDVYWDDPDYLLVDLPPGTGDVSISLAQMLPHAEMYVVTTPQPAAQRVAQRAGFMAHKVNLKVRGVIENMTWFTGDDGQRYEIFGRGGGSQLAEALEVPLLGQVPLVPAMREGGDDGHPIVVTDPSGEAAQVFANIAERVDVELAPTRRTHRELKLIYRGQLADLRCERGDVAALQQQRDAHPGHLLADELARHRGVGHDRHVRMLTPQRRDGLEPVHARHQQIEDHHIGLRVAARSMADWPSVASPAISNPSSSSWMRSSSRTSGSSSAMTTRIGPFPLGDGIRQQVPPSRPYSSRHDRTRGENA